VAQLATGQFVLNPATAPGVAATGQVVFTPVVAQAATGQFVLDLATAPSVAATANITLDANPVDAETLTVNDGVNAPVTFTFRDAPTLATDVQIGATATDTATNLAGVLNGAGLALTAAPVGTTVTLTASATGVRAAWDVATVSPNISVDASQGADPNVADGYTATVNDGVNAPVTFTFRDTPVAATDVQIGATAADSMSNLADVINGAGLSLTAAAVGDTVTLTAGFVGLRPAWALSTVGTGLSAANVSQGVAAVDNVVDGNTVTVNDGVNGATTFTFRTTPVAAQDVLIGTTETSSMTNMAGVINGAGLALTAAANSGTLTLTASTAALRSAWALSVVSQVLSVQNVSQGVTGVFPSLNVLGDIDINANHGNNSVLLGSQGGAAGQIAVGAKLLITTGVGADTVLVRNANVVGGPSTINVGNGGGVVNMVDDVFGPNLAAKPQKFALKSGTGADFVTITGCDFSGFASFDLGKGVNTVQIGSTLFESGLNVKNALLQFA
jgi:hypothetical protein